MHRHTKFGCKKFSESKDIVGQTFIDILKSCCDLDREHNNPVSSCCDLNLEKSTPIFWHKALAHDDAPLTKFVNQMQGSSKIPSGQTLTF